MPPSIRAPRVPPAAAGWRTAAVVVLAGVLMAAACGKKGPPLAPLVRTPAPMSDFSVRRSGDLVYMRLTVPTTNTDATAPADLSRIEIYAYTAVKEVEGIEPRDMTLVSSIVVRRPPDPEKEREARENAPPKPAASPKPVAPPKPDAPPAPGTPAKPVPTPKPVAPPKPPKPPEPGVDQGSVVTLTDSLTPESMTLTRLPRRLVAPPLVPADRPEQGSKLEVPNLGPVLEAKPRRFYMAYAVNRSGIRGLPSTRFAVAFDVLPPPPGTPRLEVKARTLQIAWDPPAGAAAAIERPTTEPALPVTTRGTLLPVLPSYNVYLVARPPATGPGQAQGPGQAAIIRPPEMPLPLNAKPLTSPNFVDDAIDFGVERCYQVRTVNAVGATAQLATGTTPALTAATGVAATPAISESAPSAIACVTPADTVPPPAPTSLAAVASSGAISLIWTGVDVPDLAGYLVLRSASPDGPFTPLFTQPIRETTYRDADLKPGTSYVYAVVAVDSATPPNRSPMSNTASETAR